MKMTIDKSIRELEILKKNTFGYMSAHQAFITAINIMRKYQKIKEIYDNWNVDFGVETHRAMNKIGEVIKDGNDN